MGSVGLASPQPDRMASSLSGKQQAITRMCTIATMFLLGDGPRAWASAVLQEVCVPAA